MFFRNSLKPIPGTWLNRIFIGVIVLLALVAGFYFTENQKLKNTLQTISKQNHQSGQY